MTKRGKESGNKGVTAWEMIRDVLVTSMNKGQFPMAIVAMVMLMIIWKMPPSDVSKLAFDIVAYLKTGYLFGYALAIMTIIGWFIHAKYQRRIAANELRRIAAERTRLQEDKAGKKLKSSEK